MELLGTFIIGVWLLSAAGCFWIGSAHGRPVKALLFGLLFGPAALAFIVAERNASDPPPDPTPPAEPVEHPADRTLVGWVLCIGGWIIVLFGGSLPLVVEVVVHRPSGYEEVVEFSKVYSFDVYGTTLLTLSAVGITFLATQFPRGSLACAVGVLVVVLLLVLLLVLKLPEEIAARNNSSTPVSVVPPRLGDRVVEYVARSPSTTRGEYRREARFGWLAWGMMLVGAGLAIAGAGWLAWQESEE